MKKPLLISLLSFLSVIFLIVSVEYIDYIQEVNALNNIGSNIGEVKWHGGWYDDVPIRKWWSVRSVEIKVSQDNIHTIIKELSTLENLEKIVIAGNISTATEVLMLPTIEYVDLYGTDVTRAQMSNLFELYYKNHTRYITVHNKNVMFSKYNKEGIEIE